MIAQWIRGTITHVVTTTPLVALTFDDGPDPFTTPLLLDVLARHRARATFFMIGERAVAHRELVRAIAGEGHVVGNHSWSHRSLPSLPRPRRRHEIRAGAVALRPYGAPLFRPPFGHQSLWSYLDVRSLGHQVIGWNVSVADWKAQDATILAEEIVSRITCGAIVLLHDGLHSVGDESPNRHETLLAALGAVLRTLSPRFQFVTVPDLLRGGRPRRHRWFRR